MTKEQLLEDYLCEFSKSIPIATYENSYTLHRVLLLRKPEIIAISECGQDLTNSIFFTRSAGNSQGDTISFNGQYFSLVHFPDTDILKKFTPPDTKLERYSSPIVVGKKFIREQYFNEKIEVQTEFTFLPVWLTTAPGVQPRSLLGRDCVDISAFKEAWVIWPATQQQEGYSILSVLFDAGEKAFSENHYELAIGNYIRCAYVLPDSQMLWGKIEKTFECLLGNDQKTRAIEKIAGIAPHKSNIWLRKAMLAEKFLFERTAVKFYETALDIEHNDLTITSLSNLLLKIGRPRKLIRSQAPQTYIPPPQPTQPVGPSPPRQPEPQLKATLAAPPPVQQPKIKILAETKNHGQPSLELINAARGLGINTIGINEAELKEKILLHFRNIERVHPSSISADEALKTKREEILARLAAERKSKKPANPSARINLDLVNPNLVEIVTFYEQGGRIIKAVPVGGISVSTTPNYGKNGLAIVRRDGRLNYYLRSREASPDGRPVVDLLTNHFAPIGTFVIASKEIEIEHALNHAEKKEPHDKTVCLACTYDAKKKAIEETLSEKKVLREEEKPKPTAKVRCKCGSITPIFTKARPFLFTCSSCGRKGVVR